jgi:hypothetical protein
MKGSHEGEKREAHLLLLEGEWVSLYALDEEFFLLNFIGCNCCFNKYLLNELHSHAISRIAMKAKEALQRQRLEQQETTEQLLAVLADLVETAMEDSDQDDATAGKHLREVLVKQGGYAELSQKCQAVTATAGDQYQPCMWQFYTSHRKALFHLVRGRPSAKIWSVCWLLTSCLCCVSQH